MYRWFLAYKYSFRLITLAALLAVTYSVTVLIVVISVMEGFRSELQDRIRGTTSDIKIESTDFISLEDPERIEKAIRSVPGVEATAPTVETLALFRAHHWMKDEEAEDRFLVAIDPTNPEAIEELDGYLRSVVPPKTPNRALADFLRSIFDGLPRSTEKMFSARWLERELWDLPQTPPAPDDPEGLILPAIVGSEALRQDNLFPGGRFQLTSFSPRTQQLCTRDFFVAGYFKTGLYELDSKGIILRLEDADRFLQLRGPDGTMRVSGIRVSVRGDHSGEAALTEVRTRVEKALEETGVYFARVQTWREARSSLLQAVKVEKILVSIILGVVILFAGFMIFIILTVQVVERSRDTGVLQSIGSTPRSIAVIYFVVGSSLCLAGTVLGTVYGLGFSSVVNTIQRWIKLLTGYEVFPADVYYIDRIPVRFVPEDLLFIIVPTVAASLLASVVPALRAARKDPAVALRYE